MENFDHIISTSTLRVTQRRPRACTECARRKLRCSKVIPCGACMDRGIGHLCYRENVLLRNRKANKLDRTMRSNQDTASGDVQQRDGDDVLHDFHHVPLSASSPLESSPPQGIGMPLIDTTSPYMHSDQMAPSSDNDPLAVSPTAVPRETPNTTRSSSERGRFPHSSLTSQSGLMKGVGQNTAVTLEFLALGRQHVMRLGHGLGTGSPAFLPTHSANMADPIVTPAQAFWLVDYHEKNISWMHNILHMATFREQCDTFLDSGVPISPLWLPLYYTVLSCTVYLTSPDLLQQCGIVDQQPLALHLHEKSIEFLHASNFMVNHSIFSVQAICMLIHCGHNFGESDLISTLMGSAIRIAQSLGIHRLGSDKTGSVVKSTERGKAKKQLTDREISKRVWWFLIRQDWLQIPFINTYTIHPTQFNTPKPKNCIDSLIEIGDDGVVECGIDTYTQGSYTAVLNEVAVLLWRTQDRLCLLGHPDREPDGERRLYEEIIIADTELRKIISRMPIFFREKVSQDKTLPAHIVQQREVTQLSLSHKVCNPSFCILRSDAELSRAYTHASS
ncbi:C6 transcription factor [Penicillium crustosum]|uniref:C6 transcription factor n=1 Tax=Penicillium crustosum TaxID=36656 RepID=UPI002385338C|nr:C6 transcription factor [Penicillium crustosum]KAJ5419427.1 C6 transcription factor [Penicillium crustosum]